MMRANQPQTREARPPSFDELNAQREAQLDEMFVYAQQSVSFYVKDHEKIAAYQAGVDEAAAACSLAAGAHRRLQVRAASVRGAIAQRREEQASPQRALRAAAKQLLQAGDDKRARQRLGEMRSAREQLDDAVAPDEDLGGLLDELTSEAEQQATACDEALAAAKTAHARVVAGEQAEFERGLPIESELRFAIVRGLAKREAAARQADATRRWLPAA